MFFRSCDFIFIFFALFSNFFGRTSFTLMMFSRFSWWLDKNILQNLYTNTIQVGNIRTLSLSLYQNYFYIFKNIEYDNNKLKLDPAISVAVLRYLIFYGFCIPQVTENRSFFSYYYNCTLLRQYL